MNYEFKKIFFGNTTGESSSKTRVIMKYKCLTRIYRIFRDGQDLGKCQNHDLGRLQRLRQMRILSL
jgi:hypothetical protein